MNTLVNRVRLRWAGRLGPVLGLLLMVLVPTIGSVQAAAAATPAVVRAPSDPCDALKGTPAYDYCVGDSKGKTKEPTPSGTKPADPPKDDGACSALRGTPAYEYCMGNGKDPLDTITGDCKAAPELEVPGAGMLGWIDAGPGTAPAARSIKEANADAYIYEQYGWAGLKWNTYDLGCGGALRDVQASSDNWAANKLFTWSKAWTALAVVLRQQATGDDFLADLDPMIQHATWAVRDAIFSPWVGTSVLLLGVVVLFQARKRNVSAVVQQIGWAALVMAIATGIANYPVEAAKFADTTLNAVVSQIDQTVADVDLGSSPAPQRDADPHTMLATGAPLAAAPGERANAHGNMLIHSVLYKQWLAGQLGDADSATAQKYGFELFDSQALTWREDKLPFAERLAVVKAKQKKFEEIAKKIQQEDPSAYAHLTGKKDGRLGAAIIALFSSIATNSFSFASDIVIITGKITIRFVVILFPAIAVIGLHRRMDGTVKNGLHSVMAACINIPLFAAAGAIDVLVVREVMDDRVTIPAWLKIVLLLIISYVLWKIAKPLRRMSAMVNPNHNWMEDAGGAAGGPGRFLKKTAAAYLGARYLRRMMGQTADAAVDDLTEALGDGSTRDGHGYNGKGAPNDFGTWADDGTWPGGPGSPTNPQGGGSPSAQPVATQPLYGDYESDHDFAGRERPYAAGNVASAEPDVWEGEAWYVDDLSPAASDTTPVLAAAGASPGTGSRGPGTGPAPVGPSSGGGSRLPAPRAPHSQHTPDAPAQSATSVPAGAPDYGDRPYPDATGPTVIQPSVGDDGGTVYVIYRPDQGYSVQDDRTQGLEPGEER